MARLYTRSNKRLVGGFIILIIIQIAGGVIGLLSIKQAQLKTEYYNNSLKLIHTIQASFQNQVATWKDVLIEFQSDNKTEGRKFFHVFSYHLTDVQDGLFNLKLSCSQDEKLCNQITEFRKFHKTVSKKHISALSRLSKYGYADLHNELNSISKKNKLALTKIAEIVKYINWLTENEIIKINEYYYNLLLIAIIMLTFTAIVLMLQILKKNKRSEQKMIEISKRMNSYLPPQLVFDILNENETADLKTERQYLTVCFTDLQGFTKMTEQLEPELCSKVLNEYLSEMTTIAHCWGGMVDKFIGDGMMILFGAPISENISDEAFRCIQMGIAMQKHMQVLNGKWAKEGIAYELSLRVGINSGYVTLGTFGPPDRRTYTAIGKIVNVAARLESICPPNKIMISKSTKSLVNSGIKISSTLKKSVKGITEPVDIYDVDYTTE